MKTVILFQLCVSITIADVLESYNSSSFESKIYGGDDVSLKEIRFVASFIHDNLYVCSAFMISEKHALTAAYYLKDFFLLWPLPDFDKYSLMLHGGLGQCPDTKFPIKQVECLSRYNALRPSDSSNAAIITLGENITPDAGAWIELSFSERPKHKANLTALAWGISDNEELVLKKKVVMVLGKKKCLKRYNQYVICVSSDLHFEIEDIGTPLIMGDKAIGVLGSLYGENGKMSIYTDLAEHSRNIRKMMLASPTVTTIQIPRKFAKYDWAVSHI